MSDFDPERFVYVMIPDRIGPIDRGERYEAALEEALAKSDLGTITGGGTQLGDDDADGKPTIAFCGLDVHAVDRGAVIALLRDRLPELGAPPGTQIHYTANGAKLQDALQHAGWTTASPRTFLHPYFGC